MIRNALLLLSSIDRSRTIKDATCSNKDLEKIVSTRDPTVWFMAPNNSNKIDKSQLTQMYVYHIIKGHFFTCETVNPSVRNMFFCVFTSCRFCLASPLADNNQIGSSLACIWLAHIAWRTSTSVILASNLFKYINSIFRISSQNMAMTVWYYFDVHIRSPRDYTKWISKESAPRWINKERSGGN